MKYIYSIIKDYRGPLLLIYLYIFTAQILFLFEPYIIGKAIDGLLHHNYKWLWCFLGVELIANGFIYKRMIYDTKVYIRIYNDIVHKYLNNDKKSNTSSRVARTDFAHNIINFLENDVHYYIYAMISVVGSLTFIFTQHPPTGFIVLLCAFPIILITRRFYPKIAQSTRVGHSHYEQKVTVLESDDSKKIDDFYKRRRKILIYGSTLQGKNWASLNSTKSVFLVLALIIFTNKNINLTQGQAISMYSYINQFLISLFSIPVGMEIFTRIQDVVHRISDKDVNN